MSKQPLTSDEKKAYELRVERIISQCPDQLQEEWNKGQRIFWVGNIPHVNSKVILNLPPFLPSKYQALRNRLSLAKPIEMIRK